jgi:hypothetical protein
LNSTNIIVLSAYRCGSSYATEKLAEKHNIEKNMYENIHAVDSNCIVKVKLPHNKTWAIENISNNIAYYLTRDRIDHILDLIASEQEIDIVEDWETEPVDIVVNNVDKIIEVNEYLNSIDTIILELKEYNKGIDITLEELKDADPKQQPKRIYNYINELPNYRHMDIREAVKDIVNV